jgi:hypothetical protein
VAELLHRFEESIDKHIKQYLIPFNWNEPTQTTKKKLVAAVINRIDNPCCMVGNECRIRAMTVIILHRSTT